MRSANPINRYSIVPQFLHWVTVILVLVAWALGTFDDGLPKGAARATGLFVHVSAGLLILVALITRLAWRVADPPPLLSRMNSAGCWWVPSPTRQPVLPIIHFTPCLLPFRSQGLLRSSRMVTRCRCSELVKLHHLGRVIASLRIR